MIPGDDTWSVPIWDKTPGRAAQLIGRACERATSITAESVTVGNGYKGGDQEGHCTAVLVLSHTRRQHAHFGKLWRTITTVKAAGAT